MQVKDIMTAHPVWVMPEDTVSLAGRRMAQENVGVLPVCSRDGKLRGMLTDRDIVLRCVAPEEEATELTVRQVMTRQVISVSPEDSVAEALSRMGQWQLRRLPVEEKGRLVGMISLGDLSGQKSCRMEAAKALWDIVRPIRKS